jgi:hypothetical protein
MNILTEPGGIVCGGIQIIMGRVSPWWPGKNVQSPRERRLGVINLRSQNKALHLKHLDKFYNNVFGKILVTRDVVV